MMQIELSPKDFLNLLTQYKAEKDKKKAERINIILPLHKGNAKYNKNQFVSVFLTSQPNIKFEFLPPYSPKVANRLVAMKDTSFKYRSFSQHRLFV